MTDKKPLPAAARKALLDDCVWFEAQLSPKARYPLTDPAQIAHFKAMLAHRRALLARG